MQRQNMKMSVCRLQAGLQRTLQRVLLPRVQGVVQPVLRPLWVLSQRHVHRPDQPHVSLCGQPPWMVSAPHLQEPSDVWLPSSHCDVLILLPCSSLLKIGAVVLAGASAHTAGFPFCWVNLEFKMDILAKSALNKVLHLFSVNRCSWLGAS